MKNIDIMRDKGNGILKVVLYQGYNINSYIHEGNDIGVYLYKEGIIDRMIKYQYTIDNIELKICNNVIDGGGLGEVVLQLKPLLDYAFIRMNYIDNEYLHLIDAVYYFVWDGKRWGNKGISVSL